MHGSAQEFCWVAVVVVSIAACGITAYADPGPSVTDRGQEALPPPVVRAVPTPANIFVRTAALPDDMDVPPPPLPPPSPTQPGSGAWSPPPPVPSANTPVVLSPVPSPPPPPPPQPQMQGATTTYTGPSPCEPATYTTPAPCPPAPCAAPVPLAQRGWCGCGLPCKYGSQWVIRGVAGWPFWIGTDAPDPCLYWGVDVGRTHCGCWGWNIYYRWSGCEFERAPAPDLPPGTTYTSKHDGVIHHLGAKATYDFGFGESKFYAWAGLGAGYFWTEGLLENDDGWELFAELGVGYVLSRNWKIRAGVNAHGADVSAGRKYSSEIGESRWLWLVAPVIELEVSF